MTLTTIVWVTGEHEYTKHHELSRNGIEVRVLQHAVPAIDELRSVKYPLIVLDLKLAPGLGLKERDHVIAEIMRTHSGPSAYGNIGLRVIERIRAEGSANHDTPIIVATMYEPEQDNLLPNAKELALKAGAQEYLSLGQSDLSDVVDTIRRYLRR
ncbi:hypothetical protein J4206_06450 [Candidatus Woesearchaeota archaeon]|nr:hypothetical protein [Candidatus Woesearchaeota archaeon]